MATERDSENQEDTDMGEDLKTDLLDKDLDPLPIVKKTFGAFRISNKGQKTTLTYEGVKLTITIDSPPLIDSKDFIGTSRLESITRPGSPDPKTKVKDSS